MSTWTTVERARNVGEATLLQRVLQAEGIAAEVVGEHRAAIAGELPIAEAEVEIRVPAHEADRAKGLLERLRAPESAPPWKCGDCGEENPGNFDECWNCARSSEAAAPALENLTAIPRKGFPAAVVAVLALAAVGAVALVSYRYGQSSVPTGSALTYVTLGDDPNCVEERTREGSRRLTEWCDFDRNGIWEATTTYSTAGARLTGFFDRDQNGVAEEIVDYDASGKVTVQLFDDDQNGRPERRIDRAASGNVVWYDADQDGIYEKHEP